MRQDLGTRIMNGTAVPTSEPSAAGDGVALTGKMKTKKYLLFVKLTGAGAVAAAIHVFGREAVNSEWGALGDNDGKVNNGAPISGTGTGNGVRRFFVLDNVGPFDRLYIMQS